MNKEIFEVNTMEALTHFFVSIIGDDFKAKKMKVIPEKKKPKFDTAIYIGIYGNIEGMLLIETKQSTAVNFANFLTDKEGHDVSMNELIKSYIGEIGNIIMNKTVPLLNKAFGDSYLSTPSVFIGSNIQVNLFYKVCYELAIDTQFGPFKFTFAIKE